MAVRKRKTSNKGTLIRGADGALYHIPDSALKAYRLPDHLTGEARKLMDRKGMKPKGSHVPAVRAAGLVFKAPGKAPFMVTPKPGVMVKPKPGVMVKGPKPVMVGGPQPVMVTGPKPVMVGGPKPVMVHIPNLKKAVKGKRKR